MAIEGQAAPAPDAAAPEFALPKRTSVGQNIWKFIKGKPLGAFGILLVLILGAMTVGTPRIDDWATPELPDRPFGFKLDSPWMSRYGLEDKFYTSENRLSRLESPSAEHWFGTDGNGRDTWARIIYGARRSLFIGIYALLFATVIGAGIGVISGYFRGWLDTGVQRIMDALQSFPPLIAVILVVSINPLTDSPNLFVIAGALGLVGVPSVQRITRGVVLSTREQQYVEAAKVIGATDIRTMWYYILPNIFASIIVVFSTGLGVAILAEAGLSFILPEKVPQEGASWGLMLQEAQAFLVDHPWMGLFSSGAIALAVLGFNLAGDALRDVLDPRLRL